MNLKLANFACRGITLMSEAVRWKTMLFGESRIFRAHLAVRFVLSLTLVKNKRNLFIYKTYNMKRIFMICIAVSSVLISCNKEKTDPVSKTDLLTSSPWFHMRSTAKIGGVISEAPYSSYPMCHKDDPYNFRKDGRFIISQGLSKCSTTDPDYSITYYWEFADNETILALDTGTPVNWKIVKLTKDSLVIEMGEPMVNISTNFYAHSY